VKQLENMSGSKKKTRPPPPVSILNFPTDELTMFGRYHRPSVMYFDYHMKKTVDHLWKFIEERGSKIFVAFEFTDHIPHKEFSVQLATISALEFGEPIVHVEIWPGDHVCRLGVVDDGVILGSCPPPERRSWELVCLPFNDPKKAWNICIDIMRCHNVVFKYHPWVIFQHFISRIFNPGHNELDVGVAGDYDENDPVSWAGGVHCSQFVLLFLKRCVNENALGIPDEHRDRFMNVYTFTCLPSSLRKLLIEIWPSAVSETRDYISDPELWEYHHDSD
jgi:hypothetical protein